MKITTHGFWLTIFTLTISLLLPVRIDAHPGSGIVVDRQGNIYFVDTGAGLPAKGRRFGLPAQESSKGQAGPQAGVRKIDRNGKLTRLSGPAYHWMTIDVDSRLTNVTLPYFSSGGATVTRVGVDPTLLLASDFPITVGLDGSLYYPWLRDSEQLQVFRLGTSGTTTVLTTLPANTESGPLRWLNGMVAAPDGSIYYTENRTVRRITPEGKLITVAGDVTVSTCDSVPGVHAHLGPLLRGLDVDAQGIVYVAATGCGSVVKITADGKFTNILRTSSPWSPTGVAAFGNDLYVLEYLHTEGDNRREWLPRVRKLSADGSVSTVAEIKKR